MEATGPWAKWTDAGSGTGTLVHVTRELPAPRESVFRAWTEPELFEQWFALPGTSSLHAEMDVRAGGNYRITVTRELFPGTTHVVGTYLEVVPPERLVFTWGWEDPPTLEGLQELEDVDSRVTVQFHELNHSTEVSITHERLDTEELRAFHRWGWDETLERLVVAVESR
jgi:uncharacterized protein YndB with AHSA1/START domain